MRITNARHKSSYLLGVTVAVMCGLLLFVDHGLNAAIIVISDSFDTGSGSVAGRTPDITNLPGGTYASTDNPFGAPPNVSGGTAVLEVNSAGLISLQSAGSYVKPAQFTISADVRVGTIAGNTLGVGLGFNNVNTNAFNDGDLPNKLQRITLGINGQLNFNQDPVPIVGSAYNAANFGGNPFDPNSFYHLSYRVDTSTGGVSRITLSNGFGSQSYTLSTTAFTDAKTNYAAIFSNSAAVGTSGNIDNFVVTPEPSTFALLIGAGITVLGLWRNKRGH